MSKKPRQRMRITFAKPFWIALGFVLALFFAMVATIIKVDENDVSKYRELQASSNPDKSSKADTKYIYKQYHENPTKNLYMIHEGGRLHSRLSSEKAELHFICEGDHTKIIEEMSDLVGDIQEKIENIDDQTTQTVRHFETEQAVYDYEEDLLKAEVVYVERYLSPGHNLENSNLSKRSLMKGEAEKMECSLTNKEMSLTAYQLNAAILPEDRSK